MELEFLRRIQSWHTPFLDQAMVWLTSLGDHSAIWILAGAGMLCVKKYRKAGITLLLSLLLSLLIGNVFLKNFIMRSRPCWIDTSVPLLIPVPRDYSFPSGHTMHSFAAAFSVFLYQKKAGILFLILAAGIAFSRMYLFVHFPTDILGGLLIGLLNACISYKIFQKIQLTGKDGNASK